MYRRKMGTGNASLRRRLYPFFVFKKPSFHGPATTVQKTFDRCAAACYTVVMTANDTRKLSPEAQEAIRTRVVRAVDGGMSQSEAARVFDVSRASVNAWMKKFRESGAAALESQPRGRPRRTQLEPKQAAAAARTLANKCPDELGLVHSLWSREVVCKFLEAEYGLDVSVWTASRYLSRWGFLPKRPLLWTTEQHPRAVRRWLQNDYPLLRAKAVADNAEVLWTGINEITPASKTTANMIAAINLRNQMWFMCRTGALNGAVFADFLQRLLDEKKRNIYVIAAPHEVLKSDPVRRFQSAGKARLRLVSMPGPDA